MNERSFIFIESPLNQHSKITKGEATSERIAAAGKQLFTQKSYAATSMRDIAAEAGIGAAAIYNHYPSKQALLFAILQAHMKALLSDWAERPKPKTPSARLDDFVSFHIDYHKDKAREVFLSYMELRSLEPQNLAEIARARAAYEAALVSILKEGTAAGAFHLRDVEIAAKAMIGMLAGISDWYQEGGRLGAEELKSQYIQLIRQMAGGQGV